MIKKYFAMTIIAASVSLAACSDDDDETPAPTTQMPGTGEPGTDMPGTGEPGTDMPGTGEPDTPPAPMSPAATPGVGGTAFDTIVNSPDHQMLEDAITGAGLADTLDDPASEFTIFAPTDAALQGAMDTLGADFPAGDALARVLTYHVLSGTVNAEAASQVLTNAGEEPATVDTILVDLAGTDNAVTQQITLSAGDGPNGLAVNDINVDAIDVVILGEGEAEDTASIGLVHVIGEVLLPPAAPEAPEVEMPDPENPGTEVPPGTATGVAATLEGLGNYTGFIGISTGFLQSYDNEMWTVFAPTDDALAASSATPDIQNHIAVNAGALAPAALLEAGTIATNNGIEYPVGGTADALTVGGFPVSIIATGEMGAQIYSIEGVLE